MGNKASKSTSRTPSKPVDQWNVDDVVAFLHSIDLGHLADAFRNNAVNGKDLLNLSEADFIRDLGCTQIQTRKIKESLTYVVAAHSAIYLCAVHRRLPGGKAVTAPVVKQPLVVQQQPFVQQTPIIQQQPPVVQQAVPVQGTPVMGVAAPSSTPHQRAQASQLLGVAAQALHKAIQCVNSARASAGMMTGANMMARRRGPRNRSAFGAIANVAAGAAQNSRLEQADMFVTQACNSITQAQQLVPQIPSIDLAEVQRLRGGVVRFIAIPTLTQVACCMPCCVIERCHQRAVQVHGHRQCACLRFRSRVSVCRRHWCRCNRHSGGCKTCRMISINLVYHVARTSQRVDQLCAQFVCLAVDIWELSSLCSIASLCCMINEQVK